MIHSTSLLYLESFFQTIALDGTQKVQALLLPNLNPSPTSFFGNNYLKMLLHTRKPKLKWRLTKLPNNNVR